MGAMFSANFCCTRHELLLGQFPIEPSRLSLDVSAVSEAEGRGEPVGWRGCLGGVRVRMVGSYVSRIRAASLAG